MTRRTRAERATKRRRSRHLWQVLHSICWQLGSHVNMSVRTESNLSIACLLVVQQEAWSVFLADLDDRINKQKRFNLEDLYRQAKWDHLSQF